MRSVRKLAAFSIGFGISVFAAHYALPYCHLMTAAIVATVTAACGLLFKGNTRKCIILAALAAAIGFAGYKIHYESTVIPCEALVGKTLTVDAQVLDYPTNYDNCSRVYVKLTGDDIPHVKAAVYDYDHKLTELEPGDTLRAKIRFRSAVNRYGEDVDN